MNYIVQSPMGAFHVLSACLALVAGTWILFSRKGTRRHKRWGYIYVASMASVNGSAFFLYGLFGTFGPFHAAALFSIATIVIGLVPLFNRKDPQWLRQHMYWLHFSVFGLYAALASEILTRTINGSFFLVVGLASALVVLVGGLIIYLKGKKWLSSVGSR